MAKLFPITKRVVGTSGPAGFSDAFSLTVKTTDSNAAPTDGATFAIAFAPPADTNAAQTDTAQLKFPAPDFADTSTAPTDTNTVTMRVWLSGSAGTGTTSPSNADGANNGTVATLQSAAAGTNPITLTSALGANVPSVTVTSALYRGWFKSVNTLVTSTTTITLHSTSGLFTDKVMFSNAALNTTVDHLSGDFTYDLIANGINTLAEIQSIQVLHKTNDAVAGVTPAVLTVDAGACEIAGAF